MRLFQRKKEVAVEVAPEPPRILTGIEKAEAELAETKRKEAAKVEAARREAITKQIAAIEAEIAPQMLRLQQLRSELDPYAAYRNMIYSQQQSASMSLLGALGLGGFGGRIQ